MSCLCFASMHFFQNQFLMESLGWINVETQFFFFFLLILHSSRTDGQGHSTSFHSSPSTHAYNRNTLTHSKCEFPRFNTIITDGRIARQTDGQSLQKESRWRLDLWPLTDVRWYYCGGGRDSWWVGRILMRLGRGGKLKQLHARMCIYALARTCICTLARAFSCSLISSYICMLSRVCNADSAFPSCMHLHASHLSLMSWWSGIHSSKI